MRVLDVLHHHYKEVKIHIYKEDIKADFFFCLLVLFYTLQIQCFLDYTICIIPFRAQVFTSLMVDLRQDINGNS